MPSRAIYLTTCNVLTMPWPENDGVTVLLHYPRAWVILGRAIIYSYVNHKHLDLTTQTTLSGYIDFLSKNMTKEEIMQ